MCAYLVAVISLLKELKIQGTMGAINISLLTERIQRPSGRQSRSLSH
jgi:hypothetical protein